MRIPIFAGLLAMASVSVSAEQLNYEFGYTNVAASGGGVDINLSAVYGTIGYVVRASQAVSHEIEGTVFFGVGDDSSGAVDFELEPSIEFGYRGTLQSSVPDVRYFWRASYTGLELEASSVFISRSVSDADGGPGLGVGIEWRQFTLGYTQYLGDLDNFSRINIGYRFK